MERNIPKPTTMRRRNGVTIPYATDRNGNVIICAICRKPLTAREHSGVTPYDFQITCEQHRKYRFVFDVPTFIRQQQFRFRKKKFNKHL